MKNHRPFYLGRVATYATLLPVIIVTMGLLGLGSLLVHLSGPLSTLIKLCFGMSLIAAILSLLRKERFTVLVICLLIINVVILCLLFFG